MKLPRLQDVNVRGKKILLRLDLDVPVWDGEVVHGRRIDASLPTILYLVENKCKQITILGHRGRPGGKEVPSLSEKAASQYLDQLLVKALGKEEARSLNISMMENVRFNPAELLPYPTNPQAVQFARSLAGDADLYINDAFGVCHRRDVSIVGLPDLLPHAAGFSVISEVASLEKVLEKPAAPVVFILGGGKEDKALLVDRLLAHADWVLVGGVLPRKIKSYCRDGTGGMCVSAAHLTPEGKDITPQSARAFVEIIRSAGTLVWNGPMGDIDSGFWESTEIVARAIAESKSYTVAGGGDTLGVIDKLGLVGKIDKISNGGGAMLEFLAYGDLPGLRALRQRQGKRLEVSPDRIGVRF